LRADWADITFWVRAFAGCLTVMFQKQIGARSGIEGRGCLGFDCLLGFAVVDSVVLALSAQEDAHHDVGTVGRDGSDGCDVGEEQDAVRAWVGNVGKFLEFSSGFVERSEENAAEIAGELILHAHGDLFEAQGAQLGHHAAGL